MQLTIHQPLSFSHIGQRTINQDTIYPAPGEATPQDRLFLVCDGMGGADKGEEASRLLCQAIVAYYHALDAPTLNVVHLQSALDQAYQAYRTYLDEHPLVSRMGSTLALLQVNEQGILVAHIGDSRVYQIRNGQVVFQTQDHKQVNDLVEAGIITAEQAQTHPWRNRLSRAVTGQNGGTAASRVLPDSQQIQDVQAGDYFFLCSDGALEQVDNYRLTEVLASDVPDQTKYQMLMGLCEGRTKDNYSGHLIRIDLSERTGAVLPRKYVNATTL
ncbi:PP2C family protein-serine/threonine phosphatase [uncultured Fibrella sp.]|uniref:PP2C family protein-serine/threonine phosphatase n=1 Tax=uncultured Fibrella sp. TaxID=1284596 RepID=UPI0035C984E7